MAEAKRKRWPASRPVSAVLVFCTLLGLSLAGISPRARGQEGPISPVSQDAAAVASGQAEPNPGSVQEAPYTQFIPVVMSHTNVIVIGWDGAQRDHFWQCYNRQLPECPNGLPNLQALTGGAIYRNNTTNGDTATKPGWAQILTGYNAEVTGVYHNGVYQPIPEGYTLFEKLENHFGADNIVTLFLSGKDVNTGGACVGERTYKEGKPVIEDQGQPWCLTKKHLDYYDSGFYDNKFVGDRALQLLEAYHGKPFFAFFLFRDPDVTGHLLGENSTDYALALLDNDRQLGRIVGKLRERGIYGQTTIYVITDHGFDEASNRHGNAPYGFLGSNDPRIMRGGDRKDLAATILERYGIDRGPIGPAPAVNGHSLYALPPMACVPEGGAFLDYPGALACCTGLSRISLVLRSGANCIPATGGTGDNSGYCTNCGNGVCQAPETKCNCPADCS